ncbi:hypothetical protein D7W79_22860 [Corallococcus exercitus]|uniref:Uncharacterized protein n=1 Tax=Corallococcus exercitus TaxID=2316736 RepID=A0A3A8HV66_9BACT|nr:hypothetical protein [Corallococcus exercitus]NOK32144.1 hypothetical protein [Corallococcus exercitus]RKG74448.1 hypothetical protein D7W79_22860 [Corallococcus exercitus]
MNLVSLRSFRLGSALALGLASFVFSSSALAATSSACTGGGFTVTLPNGQVLSGDRGTKLKPSQIASHGLLKVKGRYVEFDVDASTFAVYHYTLTGAANALDMTGGVRTELFTRKEPNLGTRTLDAGDLDIDLTTGSLELRRRGGNLRMKIQAKDCAQGGIFQMEPEDESGAATVITHTLATPAIYYFVNPYTGKVNFGNSAILRGKDSPQVATRISQTDTETVWSVASGGRMGGVLGEDAVEASGGATACTQDCQAQNRINGSLPVTDPAWND